MTEDNARTDAKEYSTGSIPWKYPHRHKPPRGKKLNILTEGGIAIHGDWRDDSGFLGWQDLFKRDLKQEAEYLESLKNNVDSENDANVYSQA